ncbi:MAG: UDP-2,4-diacetamido-2,4,6-trideoxy-beta-L-altropyranose hydrolase [Burkholderiaceae bacterium]|nr:UDP-2,4-diacetamido-2,4,6-trideoxy-beta-L-altropyranose hydrolase [Burkholderiaceae bacterium]
MKVALRTDASERIGTGHLMRCLTLADALRSGGARTRFVCRPLPAGLAELVTGRGHELAALPPGDGAAGGGAVGGGAAIGAAGEPEAGSVSDPPHAARLGASQADDAQATLAALAGEAAWDWLVVDHYALDARWESRLRGCARRILAIDDLADRRHDCDALLDQNLHADMQARYARRVPAHCVQLLGPRYALLRPEFGEARARLRERGEAVGRVLVFFGGIDAANLTASALDALDALGLDADVDVVIGAAHPRRAALEARSTARPRTALHVQATDMAALIAAADVGIGAAGVATWERCALGLPSLAFAVAANQQELLRDAAREGLVLGPQVDPSDPAALALQLRALLENPALRAHLARRGLESVDAQGASRVARALLQPEVVVRPATRADARDLFEWRNAPEVRRFSRSDAAIGWDDHCRWLAAVLDDPQRALLVGSAGASPAGVVRFDIDGVEAEVSIYLAPGQAGRGMGRALLDAAERWLAAHRAGVSLLGAEALARNDASHRLFTGCGFEAFSTRYRKRIDR